MLNVLLVLLEGHGRGIGIDEGAVCGGQAVELQYYEAVMGLLERGGAPAAAAAFAIAAVQQVRLP